MKLFKLVGLITVTIVFLVLAYLYLFIPKSQCQVFAEQSQSFIHGRLDVQTKIDSVYHAGKYYWPQGPFPSVILIPFQVIFGSLFNQTLMQPILVLALSYILYKLARIKKFTSIDSLKLVYVFLFGSIVFGIIINPCYSHYAHILTMTLLAYLLLELENKQRWLIMGLLSAFVIATRPTAGFIIPVILFYILRLNKNPTKKYYHLILFILPILSAISLLLWFNQVRFQNPFETGYAVNNVGDYLNSLRQKGVFNFEYIPTNFYYYFLSSVQPVFRKTTHLVFPYFAYNPVGSSFILFSPFFLYAFRSLKRKGALIKAYWITIFITLLVLLSYYSSGWFQFGPRFTSDFMPILYLLTLYGLQSSRLSSMQTVLILLSSLVNAYLLLSGFTQLNFY